MDHEDHPMPPAETAANADRDPATLPPGQHPKDSEPAGTARNFSQLVAALEDGTLNSDLTDEMRTIAETLRDHVNAYGGKPKASLSLKINFTMIDGIVDIVSEVKTTLPKVGRRGSVMWPTAQGNLSPSNPRQLVMFPEGPRGPVRTV